MGDIALAVLNGIDIVEINRIKKAMEKSGQRFVEKIFTQSEILYCESKKNGKYQSYAGRFASKEAFLKALGTGMSNGICLKDIEILNEEFGKPSIVLSGKAKDFFVNSKRKNISLSISHCRYYAVANVLIETIDLQIVNGEKHDNRQTDK